MSDFAALREANPKLKLLVSVGGAAVKSATFAGLITDAERLSNLTGSLNDLYRDDVINGVEIDWEWPAMTGDKKDRAKLVKYARVRNF